MSNITSKIKTGWLKCMENLGQGAANMADNAKQKLGELNMESRRKDLLAELPKKVMQMWKDGIELPEELNGMLTELNGINEELEALRAARLAKKQKPAITDGSDVPAEEAEAAVEEAAEEVAEEAAAAIEDVTETVEEAAEEVTEELAEGFAAAEEAVQEATEEQINY